MKRLLLGLVAVAVTALAAEWWWSTNREPSGGERERSPVAAQVRPSQAELEALSDDVTSGSTLRLRAAFGVPATQRLNPAFVAEARSWRDLEMDAASYQPIAKGVGTLTATLDKAEPTEWDITVRRVDGAWQILLTEAGG